MTTILEIQHFRGIALAEIDLSGQIVLVCGNNGALKSNLALATRAVLTSHAMPLSLSSKRSTAELRRVVSRGEQGAAVRLKSESAQRSMLWPAGEPSIRGDERELPAASIYAAGFRHLPDLPAKERAQAIASIWKTHPTSDDVLAAFKKDALAEHHERVWTQIENSGWDAATASATDYAKRLKGQWAEVTGQTWGSSIGETWQPDVSETSGTEQELETAKNALAAIDQELAAARKERDDIPEPRSRPGIVWEIETACSECGIVTTHRMVPDPETGRPVAEGSIEADSTERVTELREHKASLAGRISNLEGRYEQQARQSYILADRLEQARQAQGDAAKRASSLHRQIKDQLKIAEIVGPGGLRKSKLNDVLDAINGSLADLSATMRLPGPVRIDTDFGFWLGDWVYEDLSRGQQWALRTLVQLEIARRDGSTMVVLDDADVLDTKRMNGLVNVLQAVGVKALVCAMRNRVFTAAGERSKTVPDLAATGLGRTYWLENGRAQDVHGMAPPAPAEQDKAA